MLSRKYTTELRAVRMRIRSPATMDVKSLPQLIYNISPQQTHKRHSDEDEYECEVYGSEKCSGSHRNIFYVLVWAYIRMRKQTNVCASVMRCAVRADDTTTGTAMSSRKCAGSKERFIVSTIPNSIRKT
ncbi:hypothetical protein CBL_03314 [Carabus blaptoides fortunei]